MARAARLTLSPSLERLAGPHSKLLSRHLVWMILFASLALNLLFSGLMGYALYKRGGLKYLTAKDISGLGPRDYAMARRELYKDADRLRATSQPTVMFGDSLTGGGLWDEWYGPNVLNRGIGGEDTREAVTRAADIAALHPSRVFIMLGTNDYRRISPKETRRNIGKIIQDIQERSPRSEIFIESILPPAERSRIAWVGQVNDGLHSVAEERHARWINLVPSFSDGPFIFRSFTVDGVHLSAAGYAVWRQALAPYVAPIEPTTVDDARHVFP
jgi:lysophospholipase L1-like esterase